MEQHAAALADTTGLRVEVLQEGNRLFVLVIGYVLPPGTAKVAHTDVLFIGDGQYPLSAMDMFWTELDVVRPDGKLFARSETEESYVSRRWRRFSYHRNSVWNQNGNPLMDHFAFMESRWAESADT